MPDVEFQVGDRVVYLGFSTPDVGTITRVHVVRSDDSPDAVDVQTYDIQLDAGGNLIEIQGPIERVIE